MGQHNDSTPGPLEIALVVFLALVVLIAVLTILSPQLEAFIYNLTGR